MEIFCMYVNVLEILFWIYEEFEIFQYNIKM